VWGCLFYFLVVSIKPCPSPFTLRLFEALHLFNWIRFVVFCILSCGVFGSSLLHTHDDLSIMFIHVYFSILVSPIYTPVTKTISF